jgi:signal transduction histidine kinase/response regulator RpfG family c-di-GMP phosphodiesterase
MIKNIKTILFNEKYNWLLLLITLLSIASGLVIYFVVQNHKGTLIAYSYEKSKIVAIVVKQDVEIDLMLNDIRSLQEKALAFLERDNSLKYLSFYDADKNKLTGNSNFPLESDEDFSFSMSDDHLILVCHQKMFDLNKDVLGHVQYGYDMTSVQNIVDRLLIKFILIAFIGIALLTLMLLWVVNEVLIKIDNEVKIKIDNEANLQKNILQKSFLANMSHELRTPLNAINGFAELLSDKITNQESTLWLGLIREASSNMMFLVNDILDFSKIESNEIEFENESFDFVNLYYTVCQTLEPRVKDSIYFNYTLNNDDNVIVFGDYNRVKQILSNLISNAIKYTDKGTIMASLTIEKEEKGDIKITFNIKDTGIGIPQDKRPFIFQPFKQAHENKDRNLEGTGLGLAITKELVDRMGGQIGFMSQLGEGSNFYFNIKLPAGHRQKFKTSEFLNNGNFDVSSTASLLIAEDNKLNQMLIKTILNNWGAKVKIVNNGKEVIHVVQEEKFDAVLMDIQMPIMGGIEATSKLREIGIDIPIIALTANAYKGSHEEYVSAGMDGYVSKPIIKNILAGELEKFLGSKIKINRQPNTNTVAAPNTKNVREINLNLKQLKSICGDDNVVICKFLNLFLTSIDEDIEVMQDMLKAGDLNSIKEKAHKIKPQIDMLCSSHEQHLIREIEDKDEIMNDEKMSNKVNLFIEVMRKYKKESIDFIKNKN